MTVHRLFEEQAAARPHAPAVAAESGTVSYGELDRAAERLARRLRAQGIGPETRVAVAMEHSAERIATLLAVLKAGGAYVSLDPSDPPERRAFLLEDSRAALLLSEEETARLIADSALTPRPPLPSALAPNRERGRRPDGNSVGSTSLPSPGGPGVRLGEGPGVRADLDRIAYVIYTSGSTGRPKGVEIPHRGLLNLVLWHVRTYGVGPEDRATQLAGPGFDASVWELWPYLAAGACVVIPPKEVRTQPARLVPWMAREGITLSFLPTALAELALEEPWPPSPLRALLVGGDRLHRPPRPGLGFALVNHYGPTESSVVSTATVVEPGPPDGPAPPIGRPIDGVRVHLLDPHGRRVPEGEAGELAVGGVGLARGYLARPDLTAERFVPDAFGEEPGARLYRTGDLACRLPSGQLEFLGRIDDQVKIRGFRIELGEVEAALLRQPGVRAAAAVVRESASGERRLVAWVAPPGELRGRLDRLRAELPAFMVPAALYGLDELPLNPSGKVDRKALARREPEVDLGSGEAPRTPAEELLAGFWAELLGLGRVGLDDDVFALGAHSLLATRVLSRVSAALGVDLPLEAVFEAPTVRSLAVAVEAAAGRELQAPPVRPFPRREGDLLPASFAQERLWLLDRLTPGQPVYNIPLALRLRGALDLAVLEAALNAIIRRHEDLRTTFAEVGGEPRQVVSPFQPRPLPVIDLRDVPEADAERLLVEQALRPFDLARGPLLRAAVLRLADDDAFLFLNLHHVVSDGWSMEVLTRELADLYAGRALPDLPVQYADFAAWQREWLTGEALERQIAWWKEELAGAPTLLDLPTDRPRPALPTFRGARRNLSLPVDLARGVGRLARQGGATLFMTLLAAFQVLLGRYAGVEDVLVGSPVANRNRRELEGLIGFFANTLVLRGRPGEGSFRELLARTRASVLGASAHQDLPFERLVEELRVERSLAYNPLFQMAFAFQPPPMQGLALPGLTFELRDLQGLTSKFDLFLSLWESPDGLAGTLDFAVDLFDIGSMDRLAHRFQVLLEGIVARPDAPLAELPLLDEAERDQVVGEWNDTATVYPREASLPELFAEQARKTPGAVALRFPGGEMTYAELDARAGELAHRLRAAGIGPDRLAALRLERSAEAIVAILAVSKAGGAYVPLDPSYPAERLDFMLKDTGAQVLVTREICLDPPEAAAELPSVSPDHLAYVMYTSGSTGRPKGVAVTHRNVVRLVKETHYADLSADQVFLQLAPLSFDASTLEIWGPLLNGGTLVIHPPETPTLEELGAFLRREGITTLWLTAGLFHQMVDAQLPSLRGLLQLLAGGDVLSPAHVERVLREAPGVTLINGYGPTESTTFACCHRVQPGFTGTVPIGTPIANTRVVLLDRGLQPVPPGVPGELYIGGDGLARGYLNRPDLTAERFVPDPVWGGGGRLYRTGDLARWRPMGEIEFLGRMDQQVKIRGFRIEPGEIEAALAAHPAVADAAVVVQGEGTDKRLVAFWVAREPGEPDFRTFLESRLPAHLIPSGFVLLDALPLNPNGKVDRRALAARPTELRREAGLAPRTPIEEVLAGIWAGLLGLERVGVDEDFFALGGHSLLATRLVSRLAVELGVELSLRAVFEAPTVAGLAARIETELAGGRRPATPPVEPYVRGGRGERGERGARSPLSFAQERLWFLDRLMPGLPVYNVPLALRLSGDLDARALEAALQEIVRRHEALRTTFPATGGQPYQLISPFRPSPLATVDLPGEAEARCWLEAEAVRPFDLVEGPLIRTALLRPGDGEAVLFLNLHHIVSDGWSMEVLTRELAGLYAGESLPELPVQYADFALWQREHLAGEALERQIAWWKEELAGAPAVLELPSDRPRPPVQSFRGEQRSVVMPAMPAELAEGVHALSRRSGTTPFMTLLAAFQALLHRLSGQPDVLVGSPVANRNRPEIEGLIGFFVNTLVLRSRLGEGSFRDLLARTRASALGAYVHQDLPFEKLVEELRLERSLAYNPLFQVTFAFQPPPLAGLDLPGVRLSPVDLPERTSKFDLSLTLWEEPDGLAGTLVHAADLFDPSTAERLLRHLSVFLAGVLADPDRPVVEVGLLDDAERAQLLEWGLARGEVEDRGCLHALFEAQAARTPDAPAVSYEGSHLTYRELDRRANGLAHRLRELGAGPDRRVGICAERSLEMVVGLLTVLKAGAAYVPLDPAYPDDRLAWVLEDGGLSALLTGPGLEERMRGLGGKVLTVGLDAVPEAETPPEDQAVPDNAAYVIYTSGSTGRPKGVVVTHRNAVRLFTATEPWFGFGPHDVWTLFHSYAFDFSVWEIWGALLYGGRLVVVPYWVSRSPEELYRLLVREGVTFLNQTPSAFGQLLLAEEGLGIFPGVPDLALRCVVFGGEALNLQSLEPWWERHAEDRPRLVNMYGITETTVHVTYRPLGPADLAGAPGSWIGRAIPDLAVHVLDPGQRPVPVGVAGELCVGGAGLARGYHDRPGLTAERFIPDPFSAAPGARLYRSGDLARWRPTGELEYLGRIDHQVKIRGFRIELGEIESALVRLPGVDAAVVLVRDEAGDKRLVAWVVAPGAADPGALRAGLARELPDYMVPSRFVFLDALPLTSNGKVDRRALPEPPREDAARNGSAPPRTPTEEVLAGLWADLLGLDRVGIDEDFFALGGHSLLATRLVARVGEALGVDLPLRAVFETPTVEALAARIDATLAEMRGEPLPPIRPVPRDRPLPLSFAQERLWFLDRLEPGRPFYNMPFALRLRGDLDLARLAAALGGIVARHEALRTTFVSLGGEPRQVVAPVSPRSLPLVDLSGLPAGLREAEAARWLEREGVRPFGLERGPLLRTFALRLTPRGHELLLALHHIVGDGWSLEVLLRELETLYAGGSLPALPVQYGDFAVWQREQLRGEALERETAHWRGELAGAPTLLDLPLDRSRPAVQSFRGAALPAACPPELAAGARALGRREGATLFMIVLAAFQALLHRVSGSEDVVVGAPIANRGRREVEGLIGFFVNTLALRGRFPEGLSFRRLLVRTRAAALAAYAHQDLPFEKLVEELRVERSLSYNPLFQVLVSLQEPLSGTLDLPGLTAGWRVLPLHSVKVDLGLDLDETLHGVAGYATDLFDATTVQRLLGHFGVLLAAALADPERPVDELPLLTEAELHQTLEWNDTALDLPHVPVHEQLAAQAARTPEAVAVVFEGESLTYGELAARAARLARRLRAAGVGGGSRVGLLLECSLDLPAAILGIWQAGGAYVPLDPHQPETRLAFLIDDAIRGQKAPILVAKEPLSLDDVHVLLLEGEGAPLSRGGERGGGRGDGGEGSLDDLAYLIYTSGTTGRPKAVLVDHRNLAHTLRAAQSAFGFQAGDRMPCLAAFTFDIFLFELLAPLLAGGTSVLFPLRPTLDVPALVESLEGMTILHAVPALMREVEAVARRRPPATLRRLFVGGDAVPADLLADLRRTFPQAAITVLYGPTEATILCSCHDADGSEDRALLGRPLPGCTLELHDARGELVPAGVAGEVWIGGPGVARGYLHQPGLTAERFVDGPAGRRYRSGDLARRLADGTLEFLGRLDNQVKLRGFRIELGEIEAVLARHPEVRQAAVLAVEAVGEGAEKRLAAFVVADRPNAEDTEASLRELLASSLPEPMVPSAFVLLDALPLTPHGKVDRQALARLAPAAARPQADWVAPRTAMEVLLAGIWTEILGLERVGARDHFFALGGHSLLAIRLVSRVAEALGLDLPLRTVFEAPVLSDLAARLDAALAAGAPGASTAGAPPIVQAPRGNDLSLSFAQDRLWFLYQLEPESPRYNIVAALRLAGALDPAALRAALQEIVRRHEILRTTYLQREEGGAQRVSPPATVPLPMADLRGLPPAVREAEALRRVQEEELLPFDLRQGPVARFRLLRLEAEDWILTLSAHHVASDGWSTGLLLEELSVLYAALRQGRRPVLEDLPVQYGDFAVWQRGWLRGDTVDSLLGWWRQALEGAPVRIDLPLDRPRPAVQTFRGATRALTLPTDLLAQAQAVSQRLGATLFMTLFAAFETLLHRLTGQDDLLVGTPVAGRARRETEGLIGCFVNTLVLRGRLDPERRDEISFRDLVGRVRAMALGAFAHQDLPFEKLVEGLQVERSLGWNPLFQVFFALQNAPLAEPRLPGLSVRLVDTESETALFDLALGLGEYRGELIGGLQYNVDLFEATTAERWAHHFQVLLAGALEDPERALAGLPRIAEPERRQILSAPERREPEEQKEDLQARLAARAGELSERRSALSGRKQAALEKLLKSRAKPK